VAFDYTVSRFSPRGLSATPLSMAAAGELPLSSVWSAVPLAVLGPSFITSNRHASLHAGPVRELWATEVRFGSAQ
jgi:hypothetical protein